MLLSFPLCNANITLYKYVEGRSKLITGMLGRKKRLNTELLHVACKASVELMDLGEYGFSYAGTVPAP